MDHLTPTPLSARDEAILRRRASGATLEAIGREFGLTRARVQQIVGRAGGPSGHDVRRRIRAERAAAEEAGKEDLRKQIAELLEDSPGQTVAQIAAVLGADEALVQQAIPANLRSRVIFDIQTFDKVWTDDQVIVALRRAATFEFPLTAASYTKLLALGEVAGPSVMRLGQRYGGWTAACEFAGVESGQPRAHGYESRWTDDDILAFVRAYLEDPAYTGAFHLYDSWRAQNAPAAPSAQTVRNRLGGWREVKRRAWSK
jgi:hypothetical protein